MNFLTRLLSTCICIYIYLYILIYMQIYSSKVDSKLKKFLDSQNKFFLERFHTLFCSKYFSTLVLLHLPCPLPQSFLFVYFLHLSAQALLVCFRQIRNVSAESLKLKKYIPLGKKKWRDTPIKFEWNSQEIWMNESQTGPDQ